MTTATRSTSAATTEVGHRDFGRAAPVSPLHVGVVGCGTAGPAAALLLARAGHDVTLLEGADALHPVGAGLLVQPDGQWVLNEMRLLGPVSARAARVERLVGRTAAGRRVLDLSYADLAPGLAGLGVHRASLIDAFVSEIDRTPGCRLELGASVDSLARTGRGWQLRSPGGESLGDFDLVILANGARSHLRQATGLVRRAEEYPWGALWAIVPDPERIFPDQLEQVYRSNDTFLGFLPTGHAPSGQLPMVSVFWSVRNDRVESMRQASALQLRDAIVELCPKSAPVVDALVSWDQWVHARYMDVQLRRPYAPGLVCIGDAAHAMSPQLGQGVTLALQDAWSLAKSLGEHDRLGDALAAHDRDRRSTIRFYQLANRAATWFFQGDSRALAALRDTTFGPLNHVPIYRGQMLRTLAGFKRGLWDAQVRRQITGDLHP